MNGIGEISPGLHYVKLDNDCDSQHIWWPALVSPSWKGLMALLPVECRANASIAYLQMDINERTAENAWVYILGKSFPGYRNRAPLMAVSKKRAPSILCDFYENLDEMDQQYGSIVSWSDASSCAAKWLRDHNNDRYSLVSIPSGDMIYTHISSNAPFHSGMKKFSENLRLDISNSLPQRNPKQQRIFFETDTHSHISESELQVKNKDQVVTSIPTDCPKKVLSQFAESSCERVSKTTTSNIKQKDAQMSSTEINTPQSNRKQNSLKDLQTTEHITSSSRVQSMKVSPQEPSRKLMSINRSDIPRYENFDAVLKILKDRYGWREIKGSKSSLVHKYYVTGCYNGDSIEYIQQHLTLNEHYFTSQEAVETYLFKKVGWRGDSFYSTDKGKSKVAIPDDIEKDHEFSVVWSILRKRFGFHYRPYSPYYWNGKAEGKKFSDCKPGEDYFTTAEDLKSYVHQRFGWVGPKGKEYVLPLSSDTSVRSMRKRNRASEPLTPQNNFFGTPTAEAQSKVDMINSLSGELMSQEDNKSEQVTKNTKLDERTTASHYTDPLSSLADPSATSKDRDIVRKKLKTIDTFPNSSADQKTPVNEQPDDPIPKRRSVKTISSSIHVQPKLQPKLSSHLHKKEGALIVTKRNTSKRNKIDIDVGTREYIATALSSNVNQDAPINIHKRNKQPSSCNLSTETKVCHEEYNINERDLPLKLKLDNCSKSLCIANTSDEILFTGCESSSSYSIVKDRIITFMKQFLSQDIGRHHSSVLNICGRPGTGKTTIVQHCLRTLEKDIPNFKSTFLNAASLSTPAKLLEEISIALGKKANSNIAAIEKKLSIQNTLPIVVVIDEIDFLMTGYRPSKSKEENPIEAVLRWASTPEYALCLICISNSVGDDHAKLLHKSVKIGEEVIVRTYSESDLISIITNRLGIHKHLVDSRALTFIARKVAKLDGDARLVLDLMSSAIIKAKESLTPDVLKETTTINPVVSLPHVMSAMKNSGVIPLVDRINALPSKAKTILTIATTLGQVSSSWSVIRLNQLKKYCFEATRHEIFDELTTEGFYSIIGYLEDAGLIFPADSDDVVRGIGFDDPGEKPIRVGVQMDDVEIALEKTLFTDNSFYTKLRDYVKSHDLNNTGNNY